MCIRDSFLRGPILQSISYLRDRSLKTAAANVVLGNLMADKVAGRGILQGRIHVIANWSEDDEIVPVAATDNPLRLEMCIRDRPYGHAQSPTSVGAILQGLAALAAA